MSIQKHYFDIRFGENTSYTDRPFIVTLLIASAPTHIYFLIRVGFKCIIQVVYTVDNAC